MLTNILAVVVHRIIIFDSMIEYNGSGRAMAWNRLPKNKMAWKSNWTSLKLKFHVGNFYFFVDNMTLRKRKTREQQRGEDGAFPINQYPL